MRSLMKPHGHESAGAALYTLPFAGLLVLWSFTCRHPDEKSARMAPSAIDSLVAQFSRSSLVAVAEEHRSARIHAFLLDLLAHPGFADQVDDIVVEFGSAYYQPILDRYIAGEDVPYEELRQVWRGTTQWLVWDSPLYQEFFAAVRARNAKLPVAKRTRVVLGDPPIHWPDVDSGEDYRRFAERDSFFASVVEQEVLARDHRALLVIGGTHLYRRGPVDSAVPDMRPGVGEILAAEHPDDLFVIWTLPPSSAVADDLGMDGAPSFKRLRGSDLEQESFARLAPRGLSVRRVVDGDTSWVPMGAVRWPPMSDVADALLYLGTDSTTVDPDPTIYADPSYQAELRRRADILRDVYGFEFLPELEELISRGPP